MFPFLIPVTSIPGSASSCLSATSARSGALTQLPPLCSWPAPHWGLSTCLQGPLSLMSFLGAPVSLAPVQALTASPPCPASTWVLYTAPHPEPTQRPLRISRS